MKVRQIMGWGIPLVVITALAFSPIYGFAYIAALVYGARNLRFSATFSTIFGRSVLSFLFFAATIMVVGLAAWIAHVPVHPIMVLLGFLLLIKSFGRIAKDVSKKQFIDRGDIVSLVLALVAPVIMLTSFYLPKPSTAATYQLLSTAWDHGPHLNILQNVSETQGYFYGPPPEGTEPNDSRAMFNAYPAGWHLATTNMANGFDVNLFSPSNPLLGLHAYAVVMFGWFILTVYSFSRFAWELLGKLLTKVKQNQATVITLFILANLLLQVAVFWADLTWAFVNYTGCIAFLILMASLIVDRQKGNDKALFIGAIIAGTGAALCWFLPLPAIGLAILIGFIDWKRKILPQIFILPTKGTVAAIIVTIVAVLSVLLQVLVFMSFTTTQGGDLLNTQGAYPPPNDILLAIVTVAALVFWITAGRLTDDWRLRVIGLIAPMIIMSVIVYFYQLSTAHETTYYLYKITGLLWIISGIFFVPAFVVLIMKYVKRGGILAILVGVSLIGSLVVTTQQPLNAYNRLFREESKVDPRVAGEIIDFMKTADPDNESIVVMRGLYRTEDFNANLVSYVFNEPYDCTRRLVSIEESSDLIRRIEALATCADSLPDKKVTVITSDFTKNFIEDLDRPNLRIVNVP